jgi:DNA adenine methylase
MGRYQNPSIFDTARLQAVNQALKPACVEYKSFKDVLNHAGAGDFVYFDPPYHPLSKTSNFTSYTENNFGESEQRELAEVFCELDRQGCRVMLSNSSTPFVSRLYEGFKKHRVKASRLINSNAKRRNAITELLITNY